MKTLDGTLGLGTGKQHYVILDGLRGVAALMVVWFHVFEAFATCHADQRINHGYLAVDFFFMLSGFVIGYAYDSRWKTMTAWGFFKRRAIRLQPMVVAGALIGAALFYTQGCSFWDVSQVALVSLLAATFANMLLIPSPPGLEVRGIDEMYPLNGPTWSLLFEYIGNILYALFIHRLSTRALALLVAAAGCGLASFSLWGPYGDICAGFALTGTEWTAGSLRLLYSFSAGLLLFRLFRPMRVYGAFWLCGAALALLLAVPRLGGEDATWMNGLFEIACFGLLFPLILYLGASGSISDPVTDKVCRFLGNISYPLYMVHYPFIYLYFAWVKNNKLSFEQSLPGALAVVVGSVVLAYACLKLYDVPVRKYLAKRFLKTKG